MKAFRVQSFFLLDVRGEFDGRHSRTGLSCGAARLERTESGLSESLRGEESHRWRLTREWLVRRTRLKDLCFDIERLDRSRTFLML